MKLFRLLVMVLVAVTALVGPAIGGTGSVVEISTVADSGSAGPQQAPITAPPGIVDVAAPRVAVPIATTINEFASPADPSLSVASEHLAQQPVVAPTSSGADTSATNERRAAVDAPTQGCVAAAALTTSGAPSRTSTGGVAGTTSDDLMAFAIQYNAIRSSQCLQPVTRFIYDSCMETRLFWIAESPSPNPADAWGHIGSVRSDGVPSVGCDGNLAGGSGNTGVTVATKWWDSTSHRASLYRPGTSTSGVCIAFAMTHGGNGDPYSFTRAAARWVSC